MILISFVGKPKLLYMVIEESGQLWFGASNVDATGRTPEQYTAKAMLEDWHPVLGLEGRLQ